MAALDVPRTSGCEGANVHMPSAGIVGPPGLGSKSTLRRRVCRIRARRFAGRHTETEQSNEWRALCDDVVVQSFWRNISAEISQKGKFIIMGHHTLEELQNVMDDSGHHVFLGSDEVRSDHAEQGFFFEHVHEVHVAEAIQERQYNTHGQGELHEATDAEYHVLGSNGETAEGVSFGVQGLQENGEGALQVFLEGEHGHELQNRSGAEGVGKSTCNDKISVQVAAEKGICYRRVLKSDAVRSVLKHAWHVSYEDRSALTACSYTYCLFLPKSWASKNTKQQLGLSCILAMVSFLGIRWHGVTKHDLARVFSMKYGICSSDIEKQMELLRDKGLISITNQHILLQTTILNRVLQS